jgi:phosphoribosyl-AMP cyclohydrolase
MPLTNADLESILNGIKFDDRGLVVAIAVDAASGAPLMCAFMDREALRRTIETGKMHYYSRSRKKLWLKGETSGHMQTVREIRVDCDADALVFKIEQAGGACHTGYYSCFFRRLGDEGWIEDGRKAFDPDAVYKK